MRTARIHAASWLAVLTMLCLGGEKVVAGTTVTSVATDPLLAGAQGITTDGVNLYNVFGIPGSTTGQLAGES